MGGSELAVELDEQAAKMARLIKFAVLAGGRGWCSTSPITIARYLIDQGVTLPATTAKEENR
jgi:hypothetical protein